MNRKSIPRYAPENRLRQLNLGSIILPAAILLIGLVATGIYAYMTREVDRRDFQAGVTQQADSTGAYVDSSMRAYGQRLIAAAALMTVKEDITASEWATFYEKSQSKDSLVALMGIGYVPVLTQGELRASGDMLTTSKDSPLSVYPAGDRSVYAPITYLEPRDIYNQRAIGFDMYTDTSRRTAMEHARDTAKLAISAPVLLVQDQGVKDPHLGVLLYFPVYHSDKTPDSVEERRASLRGYVYIVFRPFDIASDYPALDTERFEGSKVILSDISVPTKPVPVYEFTGKNSHEQGEAFTAHNQLSMYGRTWDLTITRQQLASRQVGPSIILIVGGILSLISAMMSYLLFARRIRMIQETLENEVQRTKDELLALASHQLRTPASAVKQYIGMLTMGIGGELNKQQQMLAEKAYETNERQLNIINELLYVSKLDAGQLVIDPKEMNLTALVQKSLDDNADEAAEKNITLSFSRKQPVAVTADSRYVSMLIDNLISNAIKYSYPSSSVQISIKTSGDFITLLVKDSGVGLEVDEHEMIFQKFTRVDNPLSREAGGSGLGLFLARQLARAHGGDITVESVPEKGSTFTLQLPKTPTIDTNIVHLDPTYGDK